MVARDYGLTDEARQILQALQANQPDESDLHELSAEVSIPREEVDKWLGFFLGEPTWQASLTKFGAYGPPSGDYEKNLEAVDRAIREHPMLFLFPKVIYGPENVLIKEVASEQQHRAIALTEQELMGIGFFGLAFATLLEAIRDKYGVPDKDALTDFFATDFVPAQVAERFAAGLIAFWEQHYDEATHIVVPRIEWVMRELARRAGFPSSDRRSATGLAASRCSERSSGKRLRKGLSTTARGPGISTTCCAIPLARIFVTWCLTASCRP